VDPVMSTRGQLSGMKIGSDCTHRANGDPAADCGLKTPIAQKLFLVRLRPILDGRLADELCRAAQLCRTNSPCFDRLLSITSATGAPHKMFGLRWGRVAHREIHADDFQSDMANDWQQRGGKAVGVRYSTRSKSNYRSIISLCIHTIVRDPLTFIFPSDDRAVIGPEAPSHAADDFGDVRPSWRFRLW